MYRRRSASLAVACLLLGWCATRRVAEEQVTGATRLGGELAAESLSDAPPSGATIRLAGWTRVARPADDFVPAAMAPFRFPGANAAPVVPARHRVPRARRPAAARSPTSGDARLRLPAAAVPDTADDLVILEVRLGDVASRTVQARRQGDEPLLPLTQLFDLARIDATLSHEGRLVARLQPDDRELVVAAGRDTVVTVGGRPVSFAPGSLRFEDGELYLGTDALGRILGVRFAVDWGALEVMVVDPSPLPVAVLRQRELARQSLRGTRGVEAPSRVLAAERPVWDGLTVDYGVYSTSRDPLRGASWNATAGANLLGGSLELGVTSDAATTSVVQPVAASDGLTDSTVTTLERSYRVTGSWLGVWRDGRIVRQLRLGDGSTTGPNARLVRGLAVSNAPFLRPAGIGDGFYGGSIAPGWQVEAWRGGQLLAFDSVGASGTFGFNLPVVYGDNPVELVAWGPHGERRVLRRTYRVPTLLLPRGRLEYALSGGDCRGGDSTCRALGNADLRYGLSSRWTARGGLDYSRDGLAHPVLPYVGVAGTFGRAWDLEADAVVNGLVRGQLGYEPSTDASLRMDVSRFAEGASGRFNAPGRRSQMTVTGFLRPSARHESLFLEGRAERNTTAAGADQHVRLGAGARSGDFQFLPYARWDRIGGDGTLRAGLTTFILPRANWGGLLRGLWIRSTVEADGTGKPSLASLSVARSVAPTVRAEVGLAWTRGAKAPSVTLTLNSLLSSLRSLTTATATPGGPASLAQQVQGSVVLDPRGRGVAFAAGPSLQRAGIEGRVFVDENGNGRRDEGEAGAAGVRVIVGAGSVVTDSLGRYRAWDVVPFEPVIVAVDSLSFASPLWLAEFPTTAVAPGPNRYTTVDIPLVLGAVVEGRVHEGGAGVGGVALVFTAAAGGGRRTATTFSDGGYYLTGLRPGEYEITVEPRSLEALQADAPPVRFTVRSGAEGDVPPVDVPLTPRAAARP